MKRLAAGVMVQATVPDVTDLHPLGDFMAPLPEGEGVKPEQRDIGRRKKTTEFSSSSINGATKKYWNRGGSNQEQNTVRYSQF
jgi:hypothetical protein